MQIDVYPTRTNHPATETHEIRSCSEFGAIIWLFVGIGFVAAVAAAVVVFG